MDVNELKHAIKHCTENNCIGCMYRDDLQCVNHIMSAADRCIAELEERIAIMQESMEALEQRCNALDTLEDPDRIKVTRCKDCEHATMTTDGKYCKYCELVTDDDGCEKQVYYDANWYCADGKRR